MKIIRISDILKESKLHESVKKYKREKYNSPQAVEGQIFHDYDGAKAGYYNSRKILKIEGSVATIQTVDTFNGTTHLKGSPYTVHLSYVEKQIDTSAKKEHEKKENINEITHNILRAVGTFKGGNLNDESTAKELYNIYVKMKKETMKYELKDTSVPAGGFSGANSTTMRSSRAGYAILASIGGIHRGGYFGSDRPYLISFQVGGALPFEQAEGIRKAAHQILSKYTLTVTEEGYSKPFVNEESGTNYSSVMLTAPSKGDSYVTSNLLKKYFEK